MLVQSTTTEVIDFMAVFYDMIYLLTAAGLSPGGSTHLHTSNTQNNTNNYRTTQITTEQHKQQTNSVPLVFMHMITLRWVRTFAANNQQFINLDVLAALDGRLPTFRTNTVPLFGTVWSSETLKSLERNEGERNVLF
jgi:hypothetical protein